MPRLRVLLFGYNSSPAFQASTIGVAGAAINLLDQLQFKRREHPDRPIVFVCHSLGGIVVKQCLVEAHNADDVHGSILMHTRAVAFFGTPHAGGHGARLGDCIARVFRALSGSVRNDILEWLRTDSFLATHLEHNFARRAKKMRVISFMESLPISRHFGLVVPQSSSALNWREGETKVLLEATHTTVCKFSSDEDDLWIRVANHMLDLIVWAVQRPEVTIPNRSISIGYTDIPPPAYVPELEPWTDSTKRNQSQERSGKSPTEDTTDSEDMPSGWLDRIGTASPSPVLSPRPAARSRASSTDDEHIVREAKAEIWPIVMTPYPRSPHYVHRAEIWYQMISMMNRGSPIILQGIGGCGKTQKAIHLCDWFRDKNPDGSVLWITNATSTETSLAGLGSIASRMGIKKAYGEQQRLLMLKHRLEGSDVGHWLMIVDAADTLNTFESLRDFLPRCSHGQVLFTTRRNLITKDSTMRDFVFDLSKMSADEAAALVKGPVPNIDPQDIDCLIRKLDYLALAIAQAVAFMKKNTMSLKSYLSKISDEAQLTSIFKLSFERIAAENPRTMRILGYLSFLEIRAIPSDLVDILSSFEAPEDHPIDELESHCFVQWSEGRISLSLNRLVQVATQTWLQEFRGQVGAIRAPLLLIISEEFPDAAISTSWKRCEAWLPSALKILDTCSTETGTEPTGSVDLSLSRTSTTDMVELHRATAHLKAKIGLYYHKMGQWSAAGEHLQSAFEISRQNFGTMDELTLSTQATLIQTLRYLGKIRSASDMARGLKRARKANLGMLNEQTLDSYRIYALTLQDLGRWREALQASKKGLDGFREINKSDPTNLDILRLCRRISSSYRMLGQYADAEKLLREAIDAYKLRGQETSEAALDCLYGLALLQCQMKLFQEVETNSRECLRLRACLFKQNHPDVLKAAWLVGVALKGQHRWNEAEKLFNDILKQEEERAEVGKKHMYTLLLLYHLGCISEERAMEDEMMLGEGTGRHGLRKARDILHNVLAGRLDFYGAEHLEYLTTRARLAGLYFELGEIENAENQSQQVLKIVSSKQYRRHGVASAAISWMCLSTLSHYASAKARKLERSPGQEKKLKEWQKLAVVYAQRIVEGMDGTLGRQHPDTIDAARLWAETLYSAGDTKTAVKIAQRFGTGTPGIDEFVTVIYKGTPISV
jgi:tetratricopeptide (TPR) repeat protein